MESKPVLENALQLRRYDDLGKQTDLATPPIDSYAERVERCLRNSQA